MQDSPYWFGCKSADCGLAAGPAVVAINVTNLWLLHGFLSTGKCLKNLFLQGQGLDIEFLTCLDQRAFGADAKLVS